ncbi:MAG TPA: hypothetical protein VHG51_13160 [Longimicrobiaceae bacterium]|nr:hypothetical protein [Longimicrobiaceae bacterium]
MNEQSPDPTADAKAAPGRREFLGTAAGVAAVVVAAPVLAACDSVAGPDAGAEARAPVSPAEPHFNVIGIDPWIALHNKLQQTIGSADGVRVADLERTSTGYLQRIVTDSTAVGTGLATVLRRSYKFGTVPVDVSVQTSGGKAYAARSILKQGDLIAAVRDALSTNFLFDGVLRDSATTGNPVVPLIRASVVQFYAKESTDYYGNYLEVASKVFREVMVVSSGGFSLSVTTRDLGRS